MGAMFKKVCEIPHTVLSSWRAIMHVIIQNPEKSYILFNSYFPNVFVYIPCIPMNILWNLCFTDTNLENTVLPARVTQESLSNA
jgi:hypothetical protein